MKFAVINDQTTTNPNRPNSHYPGIRTCLSDTGSWTIYWQNAKTFNTKAAAISHMIAHKLRPGAFAAREEGGTVTTNVIKVVEIQ